MSNEIVKFSNQFNNVALKKFDAVHLDVLMAIASRLILSAALRKLRQLAKRLFRSVFPSRGRHARGNRRGRHVRH